MVKSFEYFGKMMGLFGGNKNRYKFSTKEQLIEDIKNGVDLKNAFLQMPSGFGKTIGADISNVDFSGVDLTGADLTKADLTNSNLSHTNLTNVGLMNTNLTSTNFSYANLTNANMASVTIKSTNLSNTIFAPKFTLKLEFSQGDFTNAKIDFDMARLIYSVFRGGNLSGVNLEGKNLSKQDFGVLVNNSPINEFSRKVSWGMYKQGDSWLTVSQNCDISNLGNLSEKKEFEAYVNTTNLSNANLSGANLSEANLYCVNFTGANLSGANLSAALFSADFRSVAEDPVYAGAQLALRHDKKGTDFTGANLSGANLSKANLHHVDFTGANLSGANLKNSDLTNSNLSDANLEGADLTNTKMSSVSK